MGKKEITKLLHHRIKLFNGRGNPERYHCHERQIIQVCLIKFVIILVIYKNCEQGYEFR